MRGTSGRWTMPFSCDVGGKAIATPDDWNPSGFGAILFAEGSIQKHEGVEKQMPKVQLQGNQITLPDDLRRCLQAPQTTRSKPRKWKREFFSSPRPQSVDALALRIS